MISGADLVWVKGNSIEIIGGTGTAMTRMRLATETAPESYDEDYGEVVSKSEEEYAELALVAKVFWNPDQELVVKEFGGEIEVAAIVHVKADDDVEAGDYLVIDDFWYAVTLVKPAPLGGYRAVAISGDRNLARVGPSLGMDIDGGDAESEYSEEMDGGGA